MNNHSGFELGRFSISNDSDQYLGHINMIRTSLIGVISELLMMLYEI